MDNRELEIARLRGELANAEEAFSKARALRDQLQAELRLLLPPFEIGQGVRVKVGQAQGRTATVDDIAQAFGDWIVKLHFVTDRYIQENRYYTYPANQLEAAQ